MSGLGAHPNRPEAIRSETGCRPTLAAAPPRKCASLVSQSPATRGQGPPHPQAPDRGRVGAPPCDRPYSLTFRVWRARYRRGSDSAQSIRSGNEPQACWNQHSNITSINRESRPKRRTSPPSTSSYHQPCSSFRHVLAMTLAWPAALTAPHAGPRRPPTIAGSWRWGRYCSAPVRESTAGMRIIATKRAA